MSADIDRPVDVPPEVTFRRGVYTKKGLRLATFSFQKKEQPLKAVMYLAHGYASHTCFDWLLPAEPGARHELYQGSVIEGLVEAGFAVRALDHTGHGYSAGAPRCFFDRYQDLVDEAEGYLRDEVKQEPECIGLPVFLFGLSMGGATVVRMALQAPDDYKGLVLYAPLLSMRFTPKQIHLECRLNDEITLMNDVRLDCSFFVLSFCTL
jgi:alpha-beta hydrolase superfamily lysophospholipase